MVSLADPSAQPIVRNRGSGRIGKGGGEQAVELVVGEGRSPASGVGEGNLVPILIVDERRAVAGGIDDGCAATGSVVHKGCDVAASVRRSHQLAGRVVATLSARSIGESRGH